MGTVTVQSAHKEHDTVGFTVHALLLVVDRIQAWVGDFGTWTTNLVQAKMSKMGDNKKMLAGSPLLRVASARQAGKGEGGKRRIVNG